MPCAYAPDGRKFTTREQRIVIWLIRVLKIRFAAAFIRSMVPSLRNKGKVRVTAGVPPSIQLTSEARPHQPRTVISIPSKSVGTLFRR
jgi:hypothetical protein